MKTTAALKQNHEFRRLYAKGKSAVSPYLALYCRKNRYGYNRLGLTVGTKVGGAVVRNRVRRRLKEAYRIHEDRYGQGYDIVVVARVRAAYALEAVEKYGAIKGGWLALRRLLRCNPITRRHRGVKYDPVP